MNKQIITVFFLAALVILSACDMEPLASIIEEAPAAPADATVDTQPPQPDGTETEAPTATSTASPQPSVTPEPTITVEPTNTPTPLPTPTPTPPSPQAILDLALFMQESAESYHFEIVEETTAANDIATTKSFNGDYLPPDVLGGVLTEQSAAGTLESSVVMFSGMVYSTDPNSGDWQFRTIKPGSTARPDNGYLRKNRFPPEEFESLTFMGVEEIDGRSLYHLSGVLPGSLLTGYGIDVDGDVLANYLIGVEDAFIYDYSLTYETLDPETGESEHAQDRIAFTDFNQPVVIDVPDITFKFKEIIEQGLGISYEIPADWVIEQSWDENCTYGSCQEIQLTRKAPGGSHSSITIASVAPSSLSFFEEVMSGPEYEDGQLGSIPARWREGEGYLDGLVFPVAYQAVQVTAQWAGHPEQEEIVRDIISRLESTTPTAAEGFNKHVLPGWGSFDIPEDWTFINPPDSEQMLISSKDVDFNYETGTEDALLQIKQLPDDFYFEQAIDLLRDELLPSISYDWEVISEPEAIQINNADAATVTYHGYEDYVEQMTVIKAPDSNNVVALLAQTGEDYWAEYKADFEAVRDSMVLENTMVFLEISPGEDLPEGYALHADDELEYQFYYPESWTRHDEYIDDTLSKIITAPSPSGPSSEMDSMVGTVTIYPPTTFIVGEDTLADEFTAVGQLDALANWSGTLTIRDAMRTSWLQSDRVAGKDYAAALYVATDEEGQPIYGFMGAVTDGESAVKMISWFDDPQTYKEEWLNIFNSIQITSAPQLDRAGAEPVEPGELAFGYIFEDKKQVHSFTGAAGDTFMLIAEVLSTMIASDGTISEGYAMIDVAVYDPQDHYLASQQDISLISPGITPITTAESGEHIIVVDPYAIETGSGYMLQLLPIDEDYPGLIDHTSGVLAGGCQEFDYDAVSALKVALYAEPTGPDAANNSLTLAMLDRDGDILVDYGEFFAEAGQPVSSLESVPDDDAFTVRICEVNDKDAEFSLIVMALE